MGKFLVSYRHKGARYGAVVNGESWSDAVEHLESMALTGKIIGQRVAEVPVNTATLMPVGLIGRLACWLRNAGGRA